MARTVAIDRVSSSGKTHLMLAAHVGCKETVEFLANKVNNINHSNHLGYDALMCAASEGHLDVVQYLVEKGADFKRCNEKGNSALMFAASEGHLDVVQYLVDNGADFKRLNKDRKSALIYAACRGHEKVVKCLLDRVDVPEQSTAYQTVLTRAALNGRQKVLKLLFDQCKVDINMKNDSGWTALSYSVMGVKALLVEWLLCRKADATILDADDDSMLMLLCSFDKKKNSTVKTTEVTKIVYLLLKNGVELFTKNKENNDVFNLAINHASEEINIGIISGILIYCISENENDKRNQYIRTSLRDVSRDRISAVIKCIHDTIVASYIPKDFSFNLYSDEERCLVSYAIEILQNSHNTKSDKKRPKRKTHSTSGDHCHAIKLSSFILNFFIVRALGATILSHEISNDLLCSYSTSLVDYIHSSLKDMYKDGLDQLVVVASTDISEETLSLGFLFMYGLHFQEVWLMCAASNLIEKSNEDVIKDGPLDVMLYNIVSFFAIKAYCRRQTCDISVEEVSQHKKQCCRE